MLDKVSHNGRSFCKLGRQYPLSLSKPTRPPLPLVHSLSCVAIVMRRYGSASVMFALSNPRESYLETPYDHVPTMTGASVSQLASPSVADGSMRRDTDW